MHRHFSLHCFNSWIGIQSPKPILNSFLMEPTDPCGPRKISLARAARSSGGFGQAKVRLAMPGVLRDECLRLKKDLDGSSSLLGRREKIITAFQLGLPTPFCFHGFCLQDPTALD